MVVHEPEIFEQDGDVRVSSRIEFETSGKRFPERLWFRFPDSLKELVTDRSDAFVVALLPLAMDLGEAIRIRGVVSPRLALGMTEYQRIQTAWHPDRFKTVDIEYGTLAAMERTSADSKKKLLWRIGLRSTPGCASATAEQRSTRKRARWKTVAAARNACEPWWALSCSAL